MRSLLTLMVWSVSIGLLAAPARSAEITTLSRADGLSVTLSGPLVLGDDERLRRAVGSSRISELRLSSGGGLIAPALEIGRLLKQHGGDSTVQERTECASACALIWLAGKNRTLERSAKVGFHAVYTIRDGKAVETAAGNALVGAYLSRLNLSDMAVVYITSTPPERITWLSPADGARVGIEFTADGPRSDRATVELTKSQFDSAIRRSRIFARIQKLQPVVPETLFELAYRDYRRGADQPQILSMIVIETMNARRARWNSVDDDTISEFLHLTIEVNKRNIRENRKSCVDVLSTASNGDLLAIQSWYNQDEINRYKEIISRIKPRSAQVPLASVDETQSYIRRVEEYVYRNNVGTFWHLQKKYGNDLGRLEGLDLVGDELEMICQMAVSSQDLWSIFKKQELIRYARRWYVPSLQEFTK